MSAGMGARWLSEKHSSIEGISEYEYFNLKP